MPRQNRAKQFMPFDALKGLNEALRLKEYESEAVIKQSLSEEKVAKLSEKILNVKKGKIYAVQYFENGHIFKILGKIKVDFSVYKIAVDSKEIDFENIVDILCIWRTWVLTFLWA